LVYSRRYLELLRQKLVFAEPNAIIPVCEGGSLVHRALQCIGHPEVWGDGLAWSATLDDLFHIPIFWEEHGDILKEVMECLTPVS
jgi:hypothetical protein